MQLRSVMQQLVEAMQQIEELAAENKDITSQLALSQQENMRLSRQLDADERTLAELHAASASREDARTAELALRERVRELEAQVESAQMGAASSQAEVCHVLVTRTPIHSAKARTQTHTLTHVAARRGA